MTWPNLERQFASWFAAAIEHERIDLADRIVTVAIGIQTFDCVSNVAFSLLLDEADSAYGCSDRREHAMAAIEDVVSELEILLSDEGNCTVQEPPVRYRVDRSTFSSRRTNVVTEIPRAVHTSFSSSTSSRRSPDSYLLTKD